MSMLRQAKAKAKETATATKKIGFVAQLQLQSGVVARFAKAVHKPQCFVPYSTAPEEETRALAHKRAKEVTGEEHTDVMACVWINVVPDTSMTPNSRYNGSFVTIGTYGRSTANPGDFLLDYISPEVYDLKDNAKFWGHIAWQRIDPDHGGNLALTSDDATNELGMIITVLESKRAATELVKSLREGEITTDDLCVARGYDVTGIRQAMKEATGGDKNAAVATPGLSELGEKTKVSYINLQGFTEPKTVEFIEQNYKNSDGDINVTAEKCSAEPGDIAILLNKPEYFRNLMEATGLGENEALVKVVAETGLANGADLATLLGIEEAPF